MIEPSIRTFISNSVYKYFILFYIYFIYFYITWNEEKVIISLIIMIFYVFTMIYSDYFFTTFKNYKDFLRSIYSFNSYRIIKMIINYLVRANKNIKIVGLRVYSLVYYIFIYYIQLIFYFNKIKQFKLFFNYYVLNGSMFKKLF